MEGLVAYSSDSDAEDDKIGEFASLVTNYAPPDEEEDEEEEGGGGKEHDQEQKTNESVPLSSDPSSLTPSNPDPAPSLPDLSSEARDSETAAPKKKKKVSKWAARSANLKKEAKINTVVPPVSSSPSSSSVHGVFVSPETHDSFIGPQMPRHDQRDRNNRATNEKRLQDNGDDKGNAFDQDVDDEEEGEEEWGGYFETAASLELQALGKDLLQTPLPLPSFLSQLIPMGESPEDVRQKLHGVYAAKLRGKSINENIALQPSFR